MFDRLLLRNVYLRKRLIATFVIFIVSAFIFTFFMSSYFYLKTVEQNLYRISIIELKSKSLIIDEKFKYFDSKIMILYSNMELRKLINESGNSDYNSVLVYDKFKNLLNSTVNSSAEQDIVSVMFYVPSNRYVYKQFATELITYNNYYYKKIKDSKGRMTLLSTQKFHFVGRSRPLECFVMGRLVNEYNQKETGYIVFLVDVNLFNSMTAAEPTIDSSSFYVFLNDGGIMLSKDSSLSAKIQQQVPNARPDGNFTIIKDDSGNYHHVSMFKSDYSGLVFMRTVPMKDFYSPVKRNIIVSLLSGFAFISIAIFISTIVATDIVSPFKRLALTMDNISKGDMSLKAGPEQNPETDKLCRYFNRMISRINTLMAENEEKQKAIAKSELETLYAQINPHFIYNTLNSIQWIALINNQKQIHDIIKSLTFLLKSCFSIDTSFITVKEESKILDSYVTLMKVRYGNFEVEYIYEDERILSSKMLKLILQPLVENSILHGFRKIDYLGRIIIYVHTDKDNLLITIKDNGIGIDDTTMKRLMSSDFKRNSSFNSIGIYNVRRRIFLNHGTDYGLKISPNMPNGTIIEIKLPIIGGE
jgi:two-component system sensor histidine kinase YesM